MCWINSPEANYKNGTNKAHKLAINKTRSQKPTIKPSNNIKIITYCKNKSSVSIMISQNLCTVTKTAQEQGDNKQKRETEKSKPKKAQNVKSKLTQKQKRHLGLIIMNTSKAMTSIFTWQLSSAQLITAQHSSTKSILKHKTHKKRKTEQK